MIVMQRRSPINRNPIAISRPPKISQIIFAIGCLSKLVLISFSNGQTINFAILKDCNPNGIPTIVIYITNQTKNKPMLPRFQQI